MQPQSSLFRRPTAEPGSAAMSPPPAPGSPEPSKAPGRSPGELNHATTGGPAPSSSSSYIAPSNGYPQSSLSYRGAPPQQSVTQTQEEENDELIKALLHDVRRAKHKFNGLGEEVKKQNTFLEQLEESFRGARTMLHKTIQRLDAASGSSGFRHMWILFVFVVVFFMFIYLLLKFRR